MRSTAPNSTAWRKIKYECLAFMTRDYKILESDFGEVFAKFGEYYQLTF